MASSSAAAGLLSRCLSALSDLTPPRFPRPCGFRLSGADFVAMVAGCPVLSGSASTVRPSGSSGCPDAPAVAATSRSVRPAELSPSAPRPVPCGAVLGVVRRSPFGRLASGRSLRAQELRKQTPCTLVSEKTFTAFQPRVVICCNFLSILANELVVNLALFKGV
jgi:hypothetical protein